MHDDGFAVALVIGVIMLVLPALWFAWWFLAGDLGGSEWRRPAA